MNALSIIARGIGLLVAGGFGTIWVLGWSAGTIGFDVMCVRQIAAQVRAASYPTVRGTVTHSRVRTTTDSDGTAYKPDVGYTYEVGGRRYESTRLYAGAGSAGRREAEAVVRAYPLDATVTVYYRPDDPSDAMLRPGVRGSDLFLVLFLTPFNAVMVGSWCVAAAWLRGRTLGPFEERLDVRPDGHRLRVRLSAVTPTAVAAMAGTATSFVALFAIAFTAGTDPPVWVVTAAYTVVATTSAYAYLRVRRTSRSGAADLWVDPLARTITLPASLGRRDPVTLSFGQVVDVTVEERAPRRGGSDDDGRLYVPTVRCREGASGRTEAAPLVEWTNPKRAANLAEWLNAEVGLAEHGLGRGRRPTGADR